MLDLDRFREEVYAIVAAIPRGKVITYGQIAWLIGMPNHSRLVGRMLHGATAVLGLPCHRVVNSQGRTAPHWREQSCLLRAEGVVFRKNGCVDMKISNSFSYLCGHGKETEILCSVGRRQSGHL